MTAEHRHEAHATITPGAHERVLGGARLPLVSIALTDHDPATAPDDGPGQRADVICQLRPSQARQLATRLQELADHAERESQR